MSSTPRSNCVNSLGYALFEPGPCDYDKVRVGDVGYIEEGSFRRLFNAFHDASSLENRGADLPEDFQPIEQRFRRLHRSESLSERAMVSESVREVQVQAVIGTSGSTGQVASNARIILECTSRSGAALLMNPSTLR